MKMRGLGLKVVTFVGVVGLVSSLLVLGVLRSRERRSEQIGARRSPTTTGSAVQLTRSKVDPNSTEAYGKLSMSFEENQGQTAREVRYVSHGNGYDLFLTPQEAVLSLRSFAAPDLSPLHRMAFFRAVREAGRARQMTAIRMRLEGANPGAKIAGTDRLPGSANYFIGNDPKKWHTGVPTYARVKYAEIYPGVDLLFYGNQRQLEYDFIVAPGADPKSIRLKLQGAQKLRVNAEGDLILSVAKGQVILQKPVVYQVVKGERRTIAGRYAVSEGHQVTFIVPDYDRSEPLILDPLLNYSTYLGGSASESGTGIAVDSLGDAFVTGFTTSSNFPVTSGSISAANTNGAVFVTKINPAGTQQLYSAYLAGTGVGGDFGTGIALDPTGNIYVTGEAFSTDFPTTNSTSPAPAVAGLKPTSPGAATGTSFITKINPAATTAAAALLYSSFLGGTNGLSPDFGNSVAADANGNAYVTGITSASPGTLPVNFPVTTANAFQLTLGTTLGNAFLTRIDTTKAGTAGLIYSTYLGGTGANAVTSGLGFGEEGLGVAVDSSSNAYLDGTTTSTDFPMTTSKNGFQITAPAAVAKGTVFLSRIDTTKSGNASLIYSTYLGGNLFDFGTAIALQPGGTGTVAYAAGLTDSSAFPTFPAGAFQVCATSGSAFVSLIDTGLSGSTSLKYSTCLGSGGSSAFGISADAAGNAYVGGGTNSAAFPVTPGAFQPAFAAGAPGEGFVSKVNPGGNGKADLVNSTFFGGSGSASSSDSINAIATDASSPPNAFITGQTFSSATTFPVFPTTAFQTTLKGPSDAFVAELTLSAPDFTLTAPATATVKDGSSVNFDVTVTPVGGFFAAVALTCTGAPMLATCTPSPTSVTSTDGVAAVKSTVTVTTVAMLPPPSLRTPPGSIRQIVPLLLVLLLLALLPMTKQRRLRLAMATAMMALIVLAGCSGKPRDHTPTGTFPLTIKGVSGSITHTATVNLTVN
jgi:Fe-S cluster assembly iron-binding protein IscA